MVRYHNAYYEDIAHRVTIFRNDPSQSGVFPYALSCLSLCFSYALSAWLKVLVTQMNAVEL